MTFTPMIAASMPRIAITIMISMRVRPSSRDVSRASAAAMRRKSDFMTSSLVFTDEGVHLEHREKNRERDERDDEAHRQDHRGLEQRGHHVDPGLHFGFVGIGDLLEHSFELAGLFSDRN